MNLHVDPAQRDRLRAILISLTAGIVIFGLKAWAFQLTGSKALESDALESAINILAAAFGLGAILFAGRPADKNHPYGHGKMEFFSAAFEGGLISLAGLWILYEAAAALLAGTAPRRLDTGLLVSAGAGLLNGGLGLYLVREGKRTSSKTLEADGHHVLSDFWTTAGILGGLLAVKVTGWNWLDPVLAGVVALLLFRTGFHLVRESAAALLDEEDTATVGRLVQAIGACLDDKVITVHGLRAIRAGRYTHVDVHAVVPEYLPVSRAHDQVEDFERRVIAAAGLEGECHTHLDPCRRRYCVRCPDAECPIRMQPFAGKKDLTEQEAVEVEPIS